MTDDRIHRLVLITAAAMAAIGVAIAMASYFFQDSSSPAGWYVAGTALFVGGVAVALDGVKWVRVLRIRMASEAAHAREPWLWREDWAARAAEEKRKSSNFAIAVAGGYVLALLPFVPRMTAKDPNFMDLVLAALAIPIVVWALLRFLRQRKQSGSICRLRAVPFTPGSTAGGSVETPIAQFDGPVKVTLDCLSSTPDSRGRSHEVALWHAESSIPCESLGHGLRGLIVPFSIGIPSTAKCTAMNPATGAIEWRLSVKAPTRGLDYDAQFEVPVFNYEPLKHEGETAFPRSPSEIEIDRLKKLVLERLDR